MLSSLTTLEILHLFKAQYILELWCGQFFTMCPSSLHLSGPGKFMMERIGNWVRNGGLGVLLYRKTQVNAYLRQTD